MLDSAAKQIVERLDALLDLHAQPAASLRREMAIATETNVTFPRDVFPRAIARVHVVDGAQLLEGFLIDLSAVALSQQRMQPFVGFEAKPFEILENARLVFGPAADSIVIFHAQQYVSADRARQAPHVDRVDDVTQVKVTCRRGRETRTHVHSSIFDLSI